MDSLIREKERRSKQLWKWKERLIPVCMCSWGIAVVVGIGSCALQIDGTGVYTPFIAVFGVLFVLIGYLEHRERSYSAEAQRLRVIQATGMDPAEEPEEASLSETAKLRRDLDDQRSRAWEFTRLVAIVSGGVISVLPPGVT